MSYSRERLGELLIEAEVITEEQLEDALTAQKAIGGKLGEVLVSKFGVTEERIASVLATQKGLEHVRLGSYPIDREAVASIPVRLARSQQVIPIAMRDGYLVLAMSDPLDIEAQDEVRFSAGRDVIVAVATSTEIMNAIDKYMVSADAFAEVELSLRDDDGPSPEDEVDPEEDMPIVRLVNQLIREAVIDRASDIHVEPEEGDVRVRYRVDGVLKEVMRLPRNARAGVTSRIKVMADLDIAERRLPQDGRAGVVVDGVAVDLRVASLPTAYGETLTIRILHEALAFRTLEKLGMRDEDREAIEDLLKAPFGAVLLAGPTGSGKTTSLYAGLSHVNRTERKIITIEDPVEYRIDGITQMAVRPKIGLTFASGLRTILRADPDIVMIGEMRDPETAEIAIRAALTGHLVLSSIHTNDAPSALTRLIDMGVPSYITSSALLGVVAQRLVRCLCDDCAQERKLKTEDYEFFGIPEEERKLIPKARFPVGCEECSDTGYRGRLGLYEVMLMTDDIRRLFLREVPSENLRDAAMYGGMRPLRMDALEKVATGITSLEEMARVV